MADDNEPATKPGLAGLLASAGTIAQLAAAFVAVVYGCGFVIVTFSQARLGILEFSALRPKVIAAGLAFILLVCIPMVLAFQWFEVFGFKFKDIEGYHWEALTDRHRSALRFINVGGYAAIAIAVSIFISSLLFPLPRPDVLDNAGAAVWFLPGGLMIYGLSRTKPSRGVFLRFPRSFLVIRLGAIAAVYFGAWWIYHDAFWLCLWLLGVPAAFYSYKSRWPKWRAIRPDILLLVLAFGLLFYSSQIYPRMKPQFGGGLPPRIIVFLSEEGPLGSPNTRIEAKLIEETDAGYYLQPANAKDAYFLPRSAVAAIQFLPEDELAVSPFFRGVS
jgi:hypothetical protein